jgi:hypothetical protein
MLPGIFSRISLLNGHMKRAEPFFCADISGDSPAVASDGSNVLILRHRFCHIGLATKLLIEYDKYLNNPVYTLQFRQRIFILQRFSEKSRGGDES